MTRARLYRPSDDPDLVRLAAKPMPGWARLRYDCAAGYAAAEALKGDSEIIVVEDGEGRIVGCGTRSTTLRYLDISMSSKGNALATLESEKDKGTARKWKSADGTLLGFCGLSRRS